MPLSTLERHSYVSYFLLKARGDNVIRLYGECNPKTAIIHRQWKSVWSQSGLCVWFDPGRGRRQDCCYFWRFVLPSESLQPLSLTGWSLVKAGTSCHVCRERTHRRTLGLGRNRSISDSFCCLMLTFGRTFDIIDERGGGFTSSSESEMTPWIIGHSLNLSYVMLKSQ